MAFEDDIVSADKNHREGRGKQERQIDGSRLCPRASDTQVSVRDNMVNRAKNILW